MMDSAVDHADSHRLVPQDEGTLVESVVKAAKACNKVFLDKCNLCTVYCDKQVQFEYIQDQIKMDVTSPITNLFSRIDNNNLEVKLYRDFLFDEESVVEGVSGRSGDPL